MRRLRSIIIALLLPVGLSGCGSKGPAETLGPVVRLLGEPGGPTVPRTRVVYEALDAATRKAVDARAAALSQRLGRPIEPSEVIQYRGFDTSVRVAAVETEQVDDSHARLRVALTRVGSTADGSAPEPLVFDAVREDGTWKLSLPSLAAEVAGP